MSSFAICLVIAIMSGGVSFLYLGEYGKGGGGVTCLLQDEYTNLILP